MLAAQVQGDLDQGVQTRLDDIEAQRDTPPLKLNDFKIPSDLPLEIPPGTEISPDLSKLTLPRDLDLSIPNDLDLSDLDFKLPEDFDLQLPEGTIFSPPGLELPNGATIKLPDGRAYELPAGSKLDLPPEVVERLLAAGVPAGRLNAPREIAMNDLPEGLTAQLDPPQFNGNGRLRLPAGTTITLPDGRKFPFPAGAIPYAARYLLPAGTSFDIPFSAEGSEDGVFPVPRPNSPTQLTGGTRSGVVTDHLLTEITTFPARVRKGEPVTVSGYVRDPSGKPVAGAPVDVYLNESKRTPGVLVGQGASDAKGTFVITLDLPEDKPARDYQLVNHASGFIDANGKAWGDGWGDPPFSTFASTSIKLELPARDGLGASTPIAGTLLDHTGAPVSGATITLLVDGNTVGRPATNAQGRFSISYSFSAGSHNVEARFGGSSNYDASSARGNITIDDYAIEISPTLRARPGDTLQLTGRVLGKGAAAPERQVSITGVFGDSLNLVSDSTGRFSYSYATSRAQAPGAYTLTYRLPEFNVVKTQTVELNLSAKLTLDAPTLSDVEEPLPVSVTLRGTTTNAAVAGQEVRLTLSGPGGSRDVVVTTDAAGTAFLSDLRPQRETPGSYTLTARVANNPYIDATTVSTTIALGQFQVVWEVPSVVVRGSDASGAATLRFNNRPLASTPVTLLFLGPMQMTTDANGRITWNVNIASWVEVGKQEIAIQTLDHPERKASFEVIAATKLELDVPDHLERGRPVDAALRLVDDRGDPVAGAMVSLVGPGLTTNVTTDEEGRWKGPLNLSSALGGGNVTLAAEYDGRSPYLGTQTVQTLSATAPVVTLARAWWLAPLVLGAAIAAGGTTWYVVKKLPRRAKAVDAGATLVAAPTLARPDFAVRFGIPDDEPAVWGVGEPLKLTIANGGPAGEFELTAAQRGADVSADTLSGHAGGTASVKLGANGSAQNTFTFPEEGEVTLVARRVDAPGTDATEAKVRIVDYRKETAREFDIFLDKAHALDASLDRRSTPREIAWTLEARLGDDARAHLDEIALVLEVTNYSHYEVSREHYLRFVRAARALDAFFRG